MPGRTLERISYEMSRLRETPAFPYTRIRFSGTTYAQSGRNRPRRVFAQRGVDTAGLVHVARAAGIGRATLYHYYPDKAALVRDVVRELLLEEEKLVRAALTGQQGSPLERGS